MKTLLQINVTSNRDSTGKITESIGVAAKEKGWDCCIAYGRDCNPSQLKTIKVGNWLNPYLHFAANRLFDLEGRVSAFATKRLIKQIRHIQPDIVHIHNIHDHWLNYPLLFDYLNQTKVKVVWTFHDFWAITGRCCHFAPCKCEQWKTNCQKCPSRSHKCLPVVDRVNETYNLKKYLFSKNNNLHIVAVSDWVGELTKQSFLKDKDIRVIPNGIDLNVFKPTEGYIHPQIKDDKFVILAVASQWVGSSKGMADYLAMSKILKDDEEIVLVGVTEKQRNSLPSNIIGICKTDSQQELAAIYTRANVVTSFSSAETFGLTIVEGYACGTPAVVYDNTAPPSLITPETGFVVPDKDYHSAYEAIQVIKQNRKESYSKACITLANEKYDKNKCFDKYIELYNELLVK